MNVTTKTDGNDIALVAIANEVWMAALQGGTRTADAITRARIDREAAASANAIVGHANDLIRTLAEAVDQLHAARTSKDARAAVSWLRSSTWSRMQEAMTRLDALATVLD